MKRFLSYIHTLLTLNFTFIHTHNSIYKLNSFLLFKQHNQIPNLHTKHDQTQEQNFIKHNFNNLKPTACQRSIHIKRTKEQTISHQNNKTTPNKNFNSTIDNLIYSNLKSISHRNRLSILNSKHKHLLHIIKFP